MANINSYNNGIFTAEATGTVKVDFIYDGGADKGQIAIFNLQGMEDLDVDSTEFITEAATRALSNSELGYVVVNDEEDRARYTDANNELAWEGEYNGGTYQDIQDFQMAGGDRFAMILVPNGGIEDILENPELALFSFSTATADNGETLNQIADVTGKGTTFGWEDVNLSASGNNPTDRDYNDVVVQVTGATATAPALTDSVYGDRNWLDTDFGAELSDYANRSLFDSGTFTVDATGKVNVDYLFDGGWNQARLAVFSLNGMGAYEPGSADFVSEAARRALSNTTDGRILIDDTKQGARYDQPVSWENNFNSGEYQGVESIMMTPGDEVAFMMVQNTNFLDVYRNTDYALRQDNKVLFSFNQDQIVALDPSGTIAFEDVDVNAANGDSDYNDFIIQAQGLTGNNIPAAEELINPDRDIRDEVIGEELLEYADRNIYSEGTFEVGETGDMTYDYIYDGGWFQGELGVFSLNGMELYEPGSEEFIEEAVRRAMTNTDLGHTLTNDKVHGSGFSGPMPWEESWNTDPENYQGVQDFSMTPGDTFGVMLVQHTSLWEISDASEIWKWAKLPIFSIPEANPTHSEENQLTQIVDIDGNGTFAFEDVPSTDGSSDGDYNDFMFQIKGAEGMATSMDSVYDTDYDWRATDLGQEILDYSNRAYFDEGVFKVGESGEVAVDFVYDGGWYSEGEAAIFSLDGMDIYEVGSEAFEEEALRRAMSNSTEGQIVIQDSEQSAKLSGNLFWENNYNADGAEYTGKQVYQMEPGDTIGLILIPGASFEEALVAPDWATKKQPMFSMFGANEPDATQMSEVLSGENGSIVGFEDAPYYSEEFHDYNDFVLAIEGVTSVGLTDISSVISDNRNWLDTEVETEIVNYDFGF